LGRLNFDLFFDPYFSVIEVLFRDGIVSKEEAPSDYTSAQMYGCHLCRLENFCSR